MKFQNDIYPFFTSKKFSTDLKVNLKNDEDMLLDRISMLEKLTKNKKIIHLGCCDHVDLINEKIIANVFLHERLYKNCNRCLGIDINTKGIEILKKSLKYNDVFSADIINDQISEIMEDTWDYLLLGEVLEHINDPIGFLNKIRTRYEGVLKKILVTVPNAFSYRNIKYSLKNLECINSDHKYWFTPYTLAKVITESGIQVSNYWLCDPYNFENKNIYRDFRTCAFFEKFLLKRHPIFRSTIIMEGIIIED